MKTFFLFIAVLIIGTFLFAIRQQDIKNIKQVQATQCHAIDHLTAVTIRALQAAKQRAQHSLPSQDPMRVHQIDLLNQEIKELLAVRRENPC